MPKPQCFVATVLSKRNRRASRSTWCRKNGMMVANSCYLLGALALIVIASLKCHYYGRASFQFRGPDPVLAPLPSYVPFLLSIVLEFITASVLLSTAASDLKGFCLAALATVFLTYRWGKSFLGIPSPCRCLGSLPSLLPLTPRQADQVAIVLALVLVTMGICGWFQGRYEKHISSL